MKDRYYWCNSEVFEDGIIDIKNTCTVYNALNLINNQDKEIRKLKNQNLKLRKTIKETREKIVEEIITQLSKIEDTFINCGNGKEDALSYFLEILKRVKGENNAKN